MQSSAFSQFHNRRLHPGPESYFCVLPWMDRRQGRLPRYCNGKESTCQCRRHKRHRFNSWVKKIPWSRKWQPAPVFLPGKFHGQRSLAGYSPWGCKESDTTEHTCTRKHTRHQLVCSVQQPPASSKESVSPSVNSLGRTEPQLLMIS